MQGPLIVAAIRPLTDLPLDTHLVSTQLLLLLFLCRLCLHSNVCSYNMSIGTGLPSLQCGMHITSCNKAVALQMIVHPEERVADFAKAGSDIISVHAEPAATVHLDRTIQQVQPVDSAAIAGVAHSCIWQQCVH